MIEVEETSNGISIKRNESELRIKTEKTEITHTKEAISVLAPEISLESDKLCHQA